MEYNNVSSMDSEKDNREDKIEPLVAEINYKFKAASDKRQDDEDRWLQAYHNYRGKYYKNIQFTEREKSRVFVKITKTKVLAAFGQIIDILFANKKFPLVVEPTPVPEGIAEFAHMETPLDEMQQEDPYGFEGDGRELAPGALQAKSNGHFLGGLKGEMGNLPLAPGPSKMGEPQISPAQKAALRMEKTIHDQLTDTNAVNVMRNSVFESCLLGTGIVKGPFNFFKRVHKWERDGDGNRNYSPFERPFHGLRWYLYGIFTLTHLLLV